MPKAAESEGSMIIIMKKNILQFLIFMRSGIAFCTTWFLILWLLYCHIFKRQFISVYSLTRFLLLIIGGVFLFNIFFTKLLIKRWGFIKRLSCFMTLIGLYEWMGFYQIGLFQNTGNFMQWSIFIGIIFVLYIICIVIYQQYSKRQGERYTQALESYQQERRKSNA